MKKVLLTSVCRPLGEKYGDPPSVGYELLFGQITREQGLFSPRSNHIHFSLEYIAHNLETPTTTLQYPSRRELIKELKQGYDIIGISFVLPTFHRMKEVVALIRKHAPESKIVLGGYGTVIDDEKLAPYADYICREEGVGFMRRLLVEAPLVMPYQHPRIVSQLRVFGFEASRTGMIFAGLGCPNGCDFCSTSHFFKRKHIRLLPEGRDIYHVVRAYQEMEPEMPLVILDEDFLLNRKRAMEFRDCVLKEGKPLSIFAFASVRALNQFTIQELLEMGLDGFWIGYEGERSGFSKQSGKKTAGELFVELREHGISVLTSMIVGFPYQTKEIIREEFKNLMALQPDYTQFLIYGPILGTPFFERVIKEDSLHAELKSDPELLYRRSCGFFANVKHEQLQAEELQSIQKKCFREAYLKLGPSIYRSVETWIMGYRKLIQSDSLLLREKADYFARQIRKAYPLFLAGKILGPTRQTRRWVGEVQKQCHQLFGRPTLREKMTACLALTLAVWTGLTLKLGLFQHPSLVRRSFH